MSKKKYFITDQYGFKKINRKPVLSKDDHTNGQTCACMDHDI